MSRLSKGLKRLGKSITRGASRLWRNMTRPIKDAFRPFNELGHALMGEQTSASKREMEAEERRQRAAAQAAERAAEFEKWAAIGKRTGGYRRGRGFTSTKYAGDEPTLGARGPLG